MHFSFSTKYVEIRFSTKYIKRNATNQGQTPSMFAGKCSNPRATIRQIITVQASKKFI